MDLELTERAAEEIRKVMDAEGLDPAEAAVRVDLGAGLPGQPGTGYVLDLVQGWSDESDVVLESQGLRVVCKQASAPRLNRTVVDFRDQASGRGFVFDRRPQMRDAAAVQEASPPTEDAVREALRAVIDPEVGINIVDLGLVYGIRCEHRRVHLALTMTTPACPLSEHIKQDAEQSVLAHCGGAVAVEIELVWDPPWGPHMMSDEAKARMGWTPEPRAEKSEGSSRSQRSFVGRVLRRFTKGHA